MQEYRLDPGLYTNGAGSEITICNVWSGRISYGGFVKEEIVYSNESIADCYAWVKAKKEGLILIK